MQEYLGQSGVLWDQLDETARQAAEATWREFYGHVLQGWPRLRHGAKADQEFRQERCSHYLIVPFSVGVAGLPTHLRGRRLNAYECRGRLVPLGTFCEVEFFVSPTDFAWTMIHTHEDHAFGGPYFIERAREWGCYQTFSVYPPRENGICRGRLSAEFVVSERPASLFVLGGASSSSHDDVGGGSETG